MDQITALALIWMWHALWMALLTYAVGRAAHRTVGWPIHYPMTCRIRGGCKVRILVWPVAGRWLLTALFLMITWMIGDVAHVVWTASLRNYPTNIGWDNVALRAAPIILEPWMFWRQWSRGLTNDEEASINVA